ncbi:MAG: glycogen debranching protein GlgX [Alphaproteobacteria bacterium]|nr:glycogen debranching protein GlgX [Alphaproteobacteria bacterium]
MNLEILPGLPYPLGANFDGNGVNFALFSKNATRVQLCLFDADGKNEKRIDLPRYTDEVWHGYIKGLRWGQRYAYRVYGPYEPEKGFRFNPNKLLLDPYAKKLTGPIKAHNSQLGYNLKSPKSDLSFSKIDDANYVPKCVVVDDNYFQWNNSQKPKHNWDEEVIYEMHVKGFTALNPDVDKAFRGTFKGLSQQKVIDYLKSLRISAVELLPIATFMTPGHLAPKGLTNYWGYDPVLFMCPYTPYMFNGSTSELKKAVYTLHEAGIEVILDVVFNHTAEGNQLGPTLCYRGIDNAVYYRLNPQNNRYYEDTTGCGASFNLGHPRVLQLVMDSLRYWAENMQIDGFRFDLATTLARDDENTFTRNSDFLGVVQQDPVLQRLKLIAEPWDLGNGGYQVGKFRPGWAEWNDKFRDTVRRFWRGDEGMAGDFAQRMTGSADLYQQNGRKPWESINFITAHDGFSLADLVSYNNKHNEQNKEENRDGTDANYSWNSGLEGQTDNPEILLNRDRRARSMMASLLLSFGTPMLCAGDEIMQSHQGNNNLYAQDNKLSWIDWKNISSAGQSMLDFTRQLMVFRRSHPIMSYYDFFKSEKLEWFKPNGQEMQGEDWAFYVKSLSYRIRQKTGDLFFVFNAYQADIEWQLPKNKKGFHWELALNSTLEPIEISDKKAKIPAWSVVVFEEIKEK